MSPPISRARHRDDAIAGTKEVLAFYAPEPNTARCSPLFK